MLKQINSVVFGAIHRFSSMTHRKIGIDNYTWSAIFFAIAAVASYYLYREAMALAAFEENPEVATVRETGGMIGLVFFPMIAGFVVFMRKDLRMLATRHYDMGNGLDQRLSLIPWFLVVTYPASLPFVHWPGSFDMALVGVALMFLLSEPPPMEQRVDRAFRKAVDKHVH